MKLGQPLDPLAICAMAQHWRILAASAFGLILQWSSLGCGRASYESDADAADPTDAAPGLAADRRGTTGRIPIPTSCVGLAATCGPNRNEDCCSSSLVPGGTYNRGSDPALPATFPATVGDFWLDKYEITVGRFR